MEPKVITIEKYECPVCHMVFDYEEDCGKHIHLRHEVGDLSGLAGKVFAIERDGRFDIIHVQTVDGPILLCECLTLWTAAKEWEYDPNYGYYISTENKDRLIEVTLEAARELWGNRVRHMYEAEIDEAITSFEDMVGEVRCAGSTSACRRARASPSASAKASRPRTSMRPAGRLTGRSRRTSGGTDTSARSTPVP